MRQTSCVILLALLCQSVAAQDQDGDLATRLLNRAGLRVGLAVLPVASDGPLAVALARAGAGMVYAQAADAAVAGRLRTHALAVGMLGRQVIVGAGPASHLPLADWTADLAIVADATDQGLAALASDELVRVLSPYRGTALVGHPSGSRGGLSRPALERWAKGLLDCGVSISEDSDGLWALVRRSAPEGADEWTHFQYNASNNPVSHDTAFTLPALVQYMSPPLISAGGSSRFAGGRMVEMQGHQHKHGPSAAIKSRMWVRNAYNGQILWEMPMPPQVEAKRPVVVVTADAIYMPDSDRAGVLVFDAETGAARPGLVLGEAGEEVKWLGLVGDRLHALIGHQAPTFPPTASYHGRDEVTPAVRSGKLSHGRRVCAWDLRGQRLLWNHQVGPELIDPCLIAAWGDSIVFMLEKPEVVMEGSDAQVAGTRLVCLDARTGAARWENPEPRLHALKRRYQFIFGREYHPGLIASDEGIRLRTTGIFDNETLIFDPRSGSTRWSLVPGSKDPARTAPRGFDGFIHAGHYYSSGRSWDIVTGEKSPDKIPWDGGCGVRVCTPAGIFGNSSGQTLGMSVKSDCHMGNFVAGGLLHAPRGWCDCNGNWRGSMAFAPRRGLSLIAAPGPERLLTGRTAAPEPMALDASDWPTYRHDHARRASTPVQVPTSVQPLWHHALETPYTFAEGVGNAMRRQDQPCEPVAAGGLVVYGGSDGRVTGLDAASGKPLWTHWCGGAVYASPTIWEGWVLVGSADGHVTCLDARNGDLLWRFRVAPHDQRIFNRMHLASRWPVLSGVLVHDGLAYAAAGLVDMMGVHVVALDARSGTLRWHQAMVRGEGATGGESAMLDPTAEEEAPETMPNQTPDGFMAIHGSRLYLRTRGGLLGRFDLADGTREPLPD